jgi:hypothetical protein
LLEDDASAQKAYAGDNVGDDLGRAGIAIEMHPDIYEGCRADRDKDMGPQPAALPVLALRPDKAAEHKRSEETDQRIQEIADSKGVQESHSP